MFNKGKYIAGEIISPNSMDVFGVICFPESIGHDAVAPLFSDIRSAGFFNVISDNDYPDNVQVIVHGGSTSLGVSSNEERDIPQIRKTLGLQRE